MTSVIAAMCVMFITRLKSTPTCESNLYRSGIHADLSPRDGFIGPGAGIGAVKLLPSVDKHRKICSVPLRDTKYRWDIFYFERVEIIVIFGVHMITMRLALETWCLTRPPPRMIIPVVLANTALLFNLRISDVHKMKWNL